MEAMLAEVSTKRAQLEALTAENERLHTRARVLETSVGCSSHIHDLMQALETLGLADAPSCRADMAGRAAAVTTAATTAAAVAVAPGAPDGASPPQHPVSHSCCSCSGDGADDAQNRVASAAQAISSAGGGGHQCQAVALAGDSTTAASPAPAIRQQLAGAFSSPEQGLQTYRAFVQDAAALMEARNRGDKGRCTVGWYYKYMCVYATHPALPATPKTHTQTHTHTDAHIHCVPTARPRACAHTQTCVCDFSTVAHYPLTQLNWRRYSPLARAAHSRN